MTASDNSHPLVQYLARIKNSKDRGALAALRSGLGKRPGEAPRMLPMIAPFLRENSGTGPYVQAVCLTASLFGLHPEITHGGNLGKSLREAVKRKHGEEGVSARLTAALDAHPDDVPHHLTGLVSLCESAGAPIDWTAFFWDAYALLGDDEDRRNRTRLNWAKGFWGAADETESAESKEIA